MKFYLTTKIFSRAYIKEREEEEEEEKRREKEGGNLALALKIAFVRGKTEESRLEVRSPI